MACGVYIWTALVNSGVDDEAGLVDWLVRTTNSITLLINVDHIGDSQQAKVGAVGINPECVRLNGI